MLKKTWFYLLLLIPPALFLSAYGLPSNEFLSASEKPAVQELTTMVEPEVKLLFVGDLFFDRYIREVIYNKGADYVFSCIDSLLKDADMAIGNLEGPITSSWSVSRGTEPGSPDNYRFTFAENTAAILAEHNFKIVNLGNNHIGNFGLEGIKSTRRLLSEANVGFFGGIGGDEPLYRTNLKGVPISFVSYNEFGGSKPAKVAEIIRQERSAGQVIVLYAHWGDEYSTDIARIQGMAKIFADSGANIIIGSHPHIVLPREQIGNAPVYYSLGNFIFDQYWNDNVSQGLAITANISRNGITTEEHPVRLQRDGRTCPAK